MTEAMESMSAIASSFTVWMDCMTRFMASLSDSSESNWTCRSAPFCALVVLSSTIVPVWPWTAASVTMDSVSIMISDRRLTDWLDPEPLSPLLMSDMAGDHPTRRLRIRGPDAPIRDRTSAPPIHRKKGPRSSRIALSMKLLTIPPLPHMRKPPLDWIQLSTYESSPNPNTNQWSR